MLQNSHQNIWNQILQTADLKLTKKYFIAVAWILKFFQSSFSGGEYTWTAVSEVKKLHQAFSFMLSKTPF